MWRDQSGGHTSTTDEERDGMRRRRRRGRRNNLRHPTTTPPPPPLPWLPYDTEMAVAATCRMIGDITYWAGNQYKNISDLRPCNFNAKMWYPMCPRIGCDVTDAMSWIPSVCWFTLLDTMMDPLKIATRIRQNQNFTSQWEMLVGIAECDKSASNPESGRWHQSCRNEMRNADASCAWIFGAFFIGTNFIMHTIPYAHTCVRGEGWTEGGACAYLLTIWLWYGVGSFYHRTQTWCKAHPATVQ